MESWGKGTLTAVWGRGYGSVLPHSSIHVQNQHGPQLDSQLGRPCPSLISDSLILSHQGHGPAIFFPAGEWLLMVSSYLQGVSSTKRILFVGVGAGVFLEAFSDYCTLVLPKRMGSLRW